MDTHHEPLVEAPVHILIPIHGLGGGGRRNKGDMLERGECDREGLEPIYIIYSFFSTLAKFNESRDKGDK